jgi:type I restriction enzyme S subunit
MKTHRAYLKYKPSGIEWLGDVPEHWEVKRLKYSAYTIMGQSPNSDDYTDDVDSIAFLQGNADFTDRFPIPRIYCETANKIVAPGALLISVRAPVGAINEADRKYGIGRGLCAIVPRESCLVKEYAWFTLQLTREELKTLATGSTYDAVSADEVGSMTFPLPPPHEQQSIATFLDRETGKIDVLVAKKELLIERLREKRSVLISHAVTKGLDPLVKLKPSGVEWLGDVPEHWEVKRLKHSFQLLTTKTENHTNTIALENIESWTGRLIVTETEFDGEGIAFDKDDILFGKLRPYLAKVLKADRFGEAVGDFFVMRPQSRINSDYAAFFLRSENFINIIDGSTFGSKMPRASWEFMGGVKIMLPPLPEQQAISAFLDRETGKIDALIAKVADAIAKLKEYRTALISAAVTGKIDVREAA